MTMNVRPSRGSGGDRTQASQESRRGSGPGAKPGRPLSIPTSDGEMARLYLSVPVQFKQDLLAVAAAQGVTASAFVYQHCEPAVAEGLTEIGATFGDRAKKYNRRGTDR